MDHAMLRTELIIATENISRSISRTNLQRTLMDVRRSSSERAQHLPALLKAFDTWRTETLQFGYAERQIMSAMEMEKYTTLEWWTAFITKCMIPEKSSENLIEFSSTINDLAFATKYLPKITKLLVRDSDPPLDELLAILTQKISPDERLTIIFPEHDGNLSSPHRLVKAIEAVSSFYEAISGLQGSSSSDLAVASVDSGSDKKIDFTGLPGVMKEVKNIFFQILDLCIFHRERKTAERLDLIKSSLPILTEISKLEGEGKIDGAKAELIRREIVKGISGVVETGIHIPEMEHARSFELRAILPTNKTLLLNPPPGSERGDPSRSAHVDVVSDGRSEVQSESAPGQAELGELTDEEREFIAKRRGTRGSSDRMA
jgi:hypothetical protein